MNPPDRQNERANEAGQAGAGLNVARRSSWWSAVAILAAALHVHAAAGLSLGFRGNAGKVVLKGPDAAQQLVLGHPDGSDATQAARWRVEPAGFATVEPGGRVRPLADGSGKVIARLPDGSEASLPVEVVSFAESQAVHFANRVVPIFTKYGCNGGGCHGKAAGQNGFRLSLLGFEPEEDYEHLVMEARGRRLFPAAPERSLLLTKAVAQVPHGGGKRMEPGSDDYQLLVRWIRQGMPVGKADAPTVARLEVFPPIRTLRADASQQLAVTAIYTDGSTEDVTRGALFEVNDRDLARADDKGLVKAFNLPGEFAVMVRYQGKVATFRGTIPLGAPVASTPPVRNLVDEHVFKRLREVGIPPSPVADDATFLRRVSIDVAGRLPTPAEASTFLSDRSENRRDAAIDRLLDSTDYADWFANKWAALLRNKRNEARQARGTLAFHGWIRDALVRNVPYDRFVRDLLTASGDMGENPPVAWFRQVTSMQSQLEDTAQLFLGQRLQCAQCHHHPYERWSQQDYWSFGAFFSQVGRRSGSQPGEDAIVHKRGVAQATNKKNGKSVRPAALGTGMGELGPDEDPREALAEWMTSPRNPWFSRSLVNRYWKHFMGRGLVEPEDDMRDTNPPTNPELLDALTAEFVRSGHDLKALVRLLTRSATYQLSAEPNAHNARDRHHFSRFYPRRLAAEILLDGVHAVVGADLKFDGIPAGTRAVCLPDNSFNAGSYFLTVFGRPDASSSCECERSNDASLSQALHLLNSKDLQSKLASDSGTAARLAADPRPEDQRIRDLYLLALGRAPKADEVRLAQEHVARKVGKANDDPGKAKARREAFEDLVWALVNTKEFLFNH
ncbi:MAG: hypothetical protein RL153_2061 [Verrucomicrobiota bacterium]